MAGSTIMPAICSGCSSNARSAAAASLNGTATTRSTNSSGSPSVCGTDAGWSRGPASSSGGNTDTISESWWPWYVPSIFRISLRPVSARMMRTASSVDSVPELPNRQYGSSNRSASMVGDDQRVLGRLREVRSQRHAVAARPPRSSGARDPSP